MRRIGLLGLLLLSAYVPAASALTFEERVEAQRAIERVYYNHRIWPKENPGPKPPFEQMVQEAVIQQKVESYLKESHALESYWHRPLTGDQLQVEMTRMAGHTKDPDVLRDLFAALHNDPFLIAECLARPTLSKRLVRGMYASDSRIHGGLKQHFLEVLGRTNPDQFAGLSEGELHRIRIRISSHGRLKQQGDWLELPQSAFDEELQSTPDVTGRIVPRESADGFELLLIESRSPQEIVGYRRTFPKMPLVEWLRKQALPITPVEAETPAGGYTCRIPDNLTVPTSPDSWAREPFIPGGRIQHTAVWTGTEMIVWGGYGTGTLGTGGRYNPSLDSWTPTSDQNAPADRRFHSAVWTGTEMIIWGGRPTAGNVNFNTGARYNPATDTWMATSTANAPAGRRDHVAVWTGTVMVVWGGRDNASVLNSGGRYNPAADHWDATSTSNAPSARRIATAVWTGDAMIVWGGSTCAIATCTTNTGGRYFPLADSWNATDTSDPDTPAGRAMHSAVWSGSEMIVWGGSTSGTQTYTNTGGRYNPILNSWLPVSTIDPDTPAARVQHSAVWTGSEMIIWGGLSGSFPFTYYTDGRRYDPIQDQWTPISTVNAPTARVDNSAVWSGSEMIIWGGANDTDTFDTGGRYHPGLDTWTDTAVHEDPVARIDHVAVWTGTEMIVWGGFGGNNYLNSGGEYDPSLDVWTPTGMTNVPTSRDWPVAVWTGSRMVIWGGAPAGDFDSTGGQYDPVSDLWTPTTTTNAPQGRAYASAVWTGTEMMVWGGYWADYISGIEYYENTGGRYNPALDSWIPMAAASLIPGRENPSAVWTGQEMIVWGGDWCSSPCTLPSLTVENTGGIYTPGTNTWVATTLNNAPQGRTGHAAAWTGSDMVIWGGYALNSNYLGDGFRFQPSPAGGSWQLLSSFNVPAPRAGHTMTWTGRDLIIWGGTNATTYFNDGASFDYSDISGSWRTLSSANAPPGRRYHSAVWTSKAILLWGGDPLSDLVVYYPNTPPTSIFTLSTSNGSDDLFVLGTGEILSLDGSTSHTGSNPETIPPLEDQLDNLFETIPPFNDSSYEWFLGSSLTTASCGSYVAPDFLGSSLALTDGTLPASVNSPGTYQAMLRVTDEVARTNCFLLPFEVRDGVPPTGTVIVPDGGDSWAFSADTVNLQHHLVVWNAVDNFPPIARAKLSYTTDGTTYTCIADSSGSDCATNALVATAGAYLWSMPTQGEAASAGQTFPTATARLKVEVWDGSNNTAADTSDANFYIIQPTTSAIKTLILWNRNRIGAQYGTPARDSLSNKLIELSDHNKVNGFILDLSTVPAINTAYAAWDGDPTNQTKANAAATAIRNYILTQLDTYSAAQYLVLVGDDTQIPQYRMTDGTTFYTEANYPPQVGLNTGTTVGSAINQGYLLTDNYYSELQPEATGLPAPHDLSYLNDLYIGRLVETPVQIEGLVNTYLAQDGQVNVTGASDRILIAGHDFLYDSAKSIRDGYMNPPASKPTDFLLDDPDAAGDEYSPASLQAQLLSATAHRVINLNDHANHFSFSTSTGSLSATTLDGSATEMAGSVVYSPGCHSGLNVPASDSHALDMPELMSKKKVVCYIGNTGYGWGLRYGTGLSEKLMELMTDEVLANGSVSIGKVLSEAKRNYHILESRYDVFDEKVEHELTLYGIPNYLVVTSLSINEKPKEELPKAADPAEKGCANGICMEKKVTTEAEERLIPPGVTELNLNFQFGSGTYNLVTTPDGQYFTLNGQSSGETGEPIQPHFAYDSALSGTVSHGVIFTGGSYSVTPAFNPVIAVPRSTNGDDGEGPIPARGTITPQMRESADTSAGGVGNETNLVVHTGNWNINTGEESIFNDMQFVVYYSNAADKTMPVITDPGVNGFHTVSGTTASFAAEVTDDTGVYRVLVTYEDAASSQWKTLDLAYNAATSKWEGSLTLTGDILYFVQAVDVSGNVGILSEGGNDVDGNGQPYGSTWSGPKVWVITGGGSSYLFFDDFEDNDVSDWTPTKGTWTASGGAMHGVFSKKADNIANGFPAGCTTCTIEADMQIDTPSARVSLLGWYTDKKNYVEVRLMEDNDKVLFKQYTTSGTAAKKAVPFTVNAGTSYHVKVSYAAGSYDVSIDGTPILTITTPVAPAGTVGFRIKSTTGEIATAVFGQISVY